MIIDNAVKNVVIDSSISSIKFTIQGGKRTGWFLLSFIELLVIGFCFMPLLGLVIANYLHKYLPAILQGIIIIFLLVLYLFIIYKKSLETFDYIFDQEIIEIDDRQITIEKTGFLELGYKKVFLAEKIKGITSSFSALSQFNFLSHLPFSSSNIGAFMIWYKHGMRPFYNFGRGVSQPEVQNMLNAIYTKYPKYRYTETK
jgi:hypothetical protein